MSYLVLARKWRPLTFDDVVGQEHVTATLKKAIEKNRVAHAYVFTGTRGVGKTTTARILARALNCEKGPTPEPCGTCESCLGVIHGTSFDVLEIDGASNNSVDDVRELRENVSYSSMGGRYRIYVIDEVHMLSKSAFNALLKTLEEPPKNVIFIFATTEPRRIPETILSRCQRYDFRRISNERILAQLEKICTAEKIAFERQALQLIARKADGSMRDGLSILDQVYSCCPDSISEKDVRSVLGLVEAEVFTALMDAVAEKRADDVLGVVEEVLQKGYDVQEFLTGVEEHVRNLLFARIPGVLEHENRNPGADMTRRLVEQSRRFSEGDLLRMTEMLRRAESDLRWSSYPRFLVEITLLKMAYMDTTVSIEQVLTALRGGAAAAALPRRPTAAAAPAPQPPAFEVKKKDEPLKSAGPAAAGSTTPLGAAEPAAAAIAADNGVISRPAEETPEAFDSAQQAHTPAAIDPAALWRDVVAAMMRDRPNLGSFLSMAYAASVRGDAIDVRFPPEYRFQFAEVTRKQNRDLLLQKLTAFAGRAMDLHISIEQRATESGQGKKQAAAVPAGAPPSLDDDMKQEPIIKSVFEIFDGEAL